MTPTRAITTLSMIAFASTAQAQSDPTAGEAQFKSCRACHLIANGDEVIFKGGKTGPNLYGVIGRVAGGADYKYSASMIAAGEAGLVWTEENLAEFIANPSAFLKEFSGDDSAKSKMTFKYKKDGSDLAAYLASVSPES